MQEFRDARGLTETESIAHYRSRNYPKPALTADVAVFIRRNGEIYLLLVRRGGHPFLGQLALPGGFANENEAVELTAARELLEETGVTDLPMKLAGVFSRPGRDPRGWVVSVAYAALMENKQLSLQAGDDASDAGWYRLDWKNGQLWLCRGEERLSPGELAFDHGEILAAALKILDLA